MKKTRTHRTPDEKEAILARIATAVSEGKTVKDACSEVGIGSSLYTNWRAGRGMVRGASKVKRAKIQATHKRVVQKKPKVAHFTMPVPEERESFRS